MLTSDGAGVPLDKELVPDELTLLSGGVDSVGALVDFCPSVSTPGAKSAGALGSAVAELVSASEPGCALDAFSVSDGFVFATPGRGAIVALATAGWFGLEAKVIMMSSMRAKAVALTTSSTPTFLTSKKAFASAAGMKSEVIECPKT